MKNLILLLCLIILLFGCDDTLTVEDVDNKPIPQSNISFSQNIYPILQVKCALSGCHAPPNPEKGLDLSNYAGVTADPNIVFPGLPDNSLLVLAIEGITPPIQKMPPNGFARPVTSEQIRGIRKWIEEGAKDN